MCSPPGLIPAHAGKTSDRSGWHPWRRAHPRSRGENTRRSALQSVGGGSSPLTRGKRRRLPPSARLSRLIPAHAGKTLGEARLRGRSRAHPRSRGENPSMSAFTVGARGSSPLTRGKPCLVRNISPLGGLIPAHAGKTISREIRRAWQLAHPRSRGENWPASGMTRSGVGSSPLTRGKPGRYRRRDRGSGLIPAHAGKT